MRKRPPDLFLIILALLMLIAMALTLRYGGVLSRHGYGGLPLRASGITT